MNIELPEKSAFPERPITLIVPFGPGGGADMQARLLEKFASQQIGQTVVVINKPGAAGTIGWNELIHAKRDGYTLGMTSMEALLHTLYTPNQTHYFTTIDPLAQISTYPLIMVVNAEQPWQSVGDIVAYAKQHPNTVKYGNSGIGAAAHVVSEAFAKETETEIGQVPFHSGSESIAALLGNHIQFVFVSAAVAKEHVRAGSLRAIAVTGEKRLTNPVFADVPTLKESGVDIVFTNWFGVGSQKELPKEVKAVLENGLKKAIADPQFQEYMTNAGLEIDYLGNEDSRRKWVREIEGLNKMLKETGIIEQVRAQKK